MGEQDLEEGCAVGGAGCVGGAGDVFEGCVLVGECVEDGVVGCGELVGEGVVGVEVVQLWAQKEGVGEGPQGL